MKDHHYLPKALIRKIKRLQKGPKMKMHISATIH